jgi:hypothetical protein
LSAIACHGPTFCVVVGLAGYVAVLSNLTQLSPAGGPTPNPSHPTAQATMTARPTVPLPTAPPAPTSTATPAASCHSWDVSGTWQFQSATMGNGQATLKQSGTSVSGTISGAVNWTLSGSIQGANVTLTMSAPGQVDQSFSGTVSASGATIDGNIGTFTGGHARCSS